MEQHTDDIDDNISTNLDDSVSVSVNDILCDVAKLSIPEPSTSGMKKPKASKNWENSDEHSQYNMVLEDDYENVHVTRSHFVPLPHFKQKRKFAKISHEDNSSSDSPISESDFNYQDNCSEDELNNLRSDCEENSQNIADIREFTAKEEFDDMRHWKACTIGEIKREIDMKVIEPYKRVLSHGGYLSENSHNAIITFSGCFLPHRNRVDYNYVMDNLFFYVLYTLNQLVTDDYVLVYLHGGVSKNSMPKFSWFKRCYQMIDRKFRKNLKTLYVVHPTLWIKTLVLMIKPFVSAKFNKKIHFIKGLTELNNILPIEDASIPDIVKQYDRLTMRCKQKNYVPESK